MILEYAHVRVDCESQSVSAILQQSVELANREPWPRCGAFGPAARTDWVRLVGREDVRIEDNIERPTVGLRLSTIRPRSRGSVKWGLEITQRGTVKRSYGSIWQSDFVSLRPSVFLPPLRSFGSMKNKKSYISITKCCGSSSSCVYGIFVSFKNLYALMRVLKKVSLTCTNNLILK